MRFWHKNPIFREGRLKLGLQGGSESLAVLPSLSLLLIPGVAVVSACSWSLLAIAQPPSPPKYMLTLYFARPETVLGPEHPHLLLLPLLLLSFLSLEREGRTKEWWLLSRKVEPSEFQELVECPATA